MSNRGYDAELVNEVCSNWIDAVVAEHESRGCDAGCSASCADDTDHAALVLAVMAKAEHERADALQAENQQLTESRNAWNDLCNEATAELNALQAKMSEEALIEIVKHLWLTDHEFASQEMSGAQKLIAATLEPAAGMRVR